MVAGLGDGIQAVFQPSLFDADVCGSVLEVLSGGYSSWRHQQLLGKAQASEIRIIRKVYLGYRVHEGETRKIRIRGWGEEDLND